MYNFLWFALLAGIGVTFASAPLGAVMMWRKMAYFGDTLAHSALLGVVVSFLLHFSQPLVGVALISVLVALLLLYGEDKTSLPSDSLLGLLSHVALAIGIVVISLIPSFRGAIFSFLFGDILAVNTQDLLMIYGSSALILILLFINWQDLLAMTVHEDLAAVEGVNVGRQRMIFVLMLALLIAMAMKVLGVLLITAMLIVPAAGARAFAKTPEGMVLISWGLSVTSVVLGLLASLFWDVPAGPAIVVVAGVGFVLSQGLAIAHRASYGRY